MKVKEAEARKYKNVFVCQRCKHKQKANSQKIRAKEIVCRNCKGRNFKPISKEKRVVG